MREVFIRQPFFPRILNQTLRPVRMSFQSGHDEYRHNYRRVGNGAEPAIHHQFHTPFSQVCRVMISLLVPVIAIDHVKHRGVRPVVQR